MITYYTVMILTYTIQGELLQSKILYPSAKECGDALEHVYPTIYKFDKSSIGQCKRTNTISKAMRPRSKPKR